MLPAVSYVAPLPPADAARCAGETGSSLELLHGKQIWVRPNKIGKLPILKVTLIHDIMKVFSQL